MAKGGLGGFSASPWEFRKPVNRDTYNIRELLVIANFLTYLLLLLVRFFPCFLGQTLHNPDFLSLPVPTDSVRYGFGHMYLSN